MENSMSKEADAILLKLLASRIDAAGAHCSSPEPEEPEAPEEPEEPCEPDDDKDKGGTTIRFL
jgi:hypothetical protein